MLFLNNNNKDTYQFHIIYFYFESWESRNSSQCHGKNVVIIKFWFQVTFNGIKDNYFRISHGRDKNKWGKWSLLLISWCVPDKIQYPSLKFNCKCYITPLFFLFNYNMALLHVGVIFPIHFCPVQAKILK